MRRLLVAFAAAWGIALMCPGLPGQMSQAVLGHAHLASSSPAAGVVLDASPTEIRLVFTEPPQAGYSSLDLLDADGRAIVLGGGLVDPADRYALVASVAELPDGTYTVNWRALSAADGHQTTGFLTFGVGDVTLAGASSGTSGEGLHSGHGAMTATLEVVAKTLGYGGSMIAFGLLALAFVAIRPSLGVLPAGLAGGFVAVLVASAFGAILLITTALDDLGAAAGGSAADPLTFVTSSRIGGILALRALVGLLGAVGVALLARGGRIRAAVLVGGVAGTLEIVLIASMGHASAFASIAPFASALVHLGAGGIWLAGLAGLSALVLIDGATATTLRPIVVRFGALALAAVALIGASGIYASWLMQRELVSLGTVYGVGLAIKVALVIGALGVGALNYLAGDSDEATHGRSDRLSFGFDRRIVVEAILAATVLGATANLTSGSPPVSNLPVPIAPAVSTTLAIEGLGLGIQPGRPGSNRVWVTIQPAASPGTSVELELTRLDAATGSSRVAIPENPNVPPGLAGTAWSTGAVLPANSSWEAIAIVSAPDGLELGRQRFTFALDSSGVSAGRQVPPVDPALVIAILLLGGGVLGVGWLLSGGSLPRVDRRAGRVALAGGSVVSGLLGLVLLLGTPPA